jgi:hypothetical protein
MIRITNIPQSHKWRADDEFPVSGDALAMERDTHPTQPFRWGDTLWPPVLPGGVRMNARHAREIRAGVLWGRRLAHSGYTRRFAVEMLTGNSPEPMRTVHAARRTYARMAKKGASA